MSITYETGLRKPGDMFDLYKTLGWADMLSLTRQQMETAISGSRHIIYAYDNDELVGTGRVLTDGALHTYLCGLGVLKEFRGRGIGSEIVNRLSSYCEANGLHPQFLCEEHMVPFYEKLGFKAFSIGMKK